MINGNARYELNGGKLLVNGEVVPLRKGIVYLALAKAGWDGHEGPLSPELVESMLRLDRRISLMAFSTRTQPAA